MAMVKSPASGTDKISFIFEGERVESHTLTFGLEPTQTYTETQIEALGNAFGAILDGISGAQWVGMKWQSTEWTTDNYTALGQGEMYIRGEFEFSTRFRKRIKLSIPGFDLRNAVGAAGQTGVPPLTTHVNNPPPAQPIDYQQLGLAGLRFQKTLIDMSNVAVDDFVLSMINGVHYTWVEGPTTYNETYKPWGAKVEDGEISCVVNGLITIKERKCINVCI